MEERIIKDINDLLTQLFQKIKKAGYEWDADKLELKKLRIINTTLEEKAEIDSAFTKMMLKSKPTKWSDEDEKIKLWIIEYVNHLPLLYAEIEIDGEDVSTKEHRDKVISWLKSLKDRVQPRQEWSEEGKRVP